MGLQGYIDELEARKLEVHKKKEKLRLKRLRIEEIQSSHRTLQRKLFYHFYHFFSLKQDPSVLPTHSSRLTHNPDFQLKHLEIKLIENP